MVRRPKTTRAAARLAELLEHNGKPVLTPFDLFRMVWRMYESPSRAGLYLSGNFPDREACHRLRRGLASASVIREDRDYGRRIIRVLRVADLAAEDIVCLVDPTCHVSHLSAMQRWGLTDRSSRALMLARPDRNTARKVLETHRERALGDSEFNPFPIRLVQHPAHVRRRPVSVHTSNTARSFVGIPDTGIRLSTVGQTFLDMVRDPQLCGGMSHVLDVWEEHVKTYLPEVVDAVGGAPGQIVKIRAGYIIEEYLKLHHPGVEAWKALAQQGGSRKLDPAREFAPTFSETWMLSINV